MTKHHHHGRHHNRPPVSATKLTPEQAKAQHRKHGTHIDFDSDALESGKAYGKGGKGGVSLTFTDGSNYFYADMDASDLAELRDAPSTGKTFNSDYR